MIKLRRPSPAAWLDTVMADFDAFMLDHACCERKASAMAMSLVAHYPDRLELVEAMIKLAREELEHFHQVWTRLTERGLVLGSDTKDGYVGALLKEIRRGTDFYFLDRLLVAGVIEARGHERFGLVAEALPAGPMRDFYTELTHSEARHHGLFVKLARSYFEPSLVQERLDELLEAEAEIMSAQPLRAAVH